MQNLSAMMTRVLNNAKKNGIDIQPMTAEEKKDWDRKAFMKSKEEADRFKQRQWRCKSLWSGNNPLHFTLDLWKPELQKNSQLAATLGNQAFRFAQQMAKKDFNVLMVGPAGTGKTSLALAIAEKLVADKQREYVFISTMALSRLFNDRFHDNGESEERIRMLYKAASKTKLLILDDFGTEAGMKQYDKQESTRYKPVRKDMQEWLFDLSNARYEEATNSHKGSTIITTNHSGKDLMQMYQPKILSRLIPKGEQNIMKFNGLEDMRR